jgi:hypothetical protein
MTTWALPDHDDVETSWRGVWMAVWVMRWIGRPSLSIVTSSVTKRWPFRSMVPVGADRRVGTGL